MTPEGRVKAMVNRRLAAYPAIYRFMPVQNGMGAPSLDILLCVVGQFLAIETKAPGKKPTPRQETTIAAIRAAGGKVFVVDDKVSLDVVTKYIWDLYTQIDNRNAHKRTCP